MIALLAPRSARGGVAPKAGEIATTKVRWDRSSRGMLARCFSRGSRPLRAAPTAFNSGWPCPQRMLPSQRLAYPSGAPGVHPRQDHLRHPPIGPAALISSAIWVRRLTSARNAPRTPGGPVRNQRPPTDGGPLSAPLRLLRGRAGGGRLGRRWRRMRPTECGLSPLRSNTWVTGRTLSGPRQRGTPLRGATGSRRAAPTDTRLPSPSA